MARQVQSASATDKGGEGRGWTSLSGYLVPCGLLPPAHFLLYTILPRSGAVGQARQVGEQNTGYILRWSRNLTWELSGATSERTVSVLTVSWCILPKPLMASLTSTSAPPLSAMAMGTLLSRKMSK